MPVGRGLIEQEFPALSSLTYLNTAFAGLPPKSTVEAMYQYMHDRMHVRWSFEKTFEIVDSCRELLTRFLGGDASEYGLVASTSAGLNAIAQAIEYPEGANIVLCDLEFPANFLPWQSVCRQRGLELRVVRSEDGAASAEQFAELIDDRTRVVAVSHVQFGTGYRVDLEVLARTVHEVGGVLVSDIIQSAGWMDMDLDKMGVDFAAAQGSKWLLAPNGTGFVFARREAMREVTPRLYGWWSVEDMLDLKYGEKRPAGDARVFQLGMPALVTYVGLVRSLRLLLDIPAAEREGLAMGLAAHLRDALTDMGVEYYDFGPDGYSPIVSCAVQDAKALKERLRAHSVHCSVRQGRLRVSPYIYNDREDIEKLLDALR